MDFLLSIMSIKEHPLVHFKALFCPYGKQILLRDYLSKTSISTTLTQKNALPAGFTLVELLVTLCALSIMLMVAIPSIQTMILNNRLTAGTDLLVNGLNYTRGAALSNGASVRICPFSAANSTTCGTDWSQGWVVITQPSSGAATLLQSQQNGAISPTIGANASSVTFDSHGLASSQTNFTLCDTRGNIFGRSVEVMATGFIQSGPTPGQAVWNNNALTCP
jgi:type IV fimbrial biogenesis protein FimT